MMWEYRIIGNTGKSLRGDIIQDDDLKGEKKTVKQK